MVVFSAGCFEAVLAEEAVDFLFVFFGYVEWEGSYA